MLALMKLLMVYPIILRVVKYLCVFSLARDLTNLFNPESKANGYI